MTNKSPCSRKLNSLNSLLCPAVETAFCSLFWEEREKQTTADCESQSENGNQTLQIAYGSDSFSPNAKIIKLLLHLELDGKNNARHTVFPHFYYFCFLY